MCVHYNPDSPENIRQKIQADLPLSYPAETWPGYRAPIVRRKKGARAEMEVLLARMGMIPPWAKDDAIGKKTYNARTETVAEKPSFRHAWKAHQLCLVPMLGFYEPNWETGKAVRWRIRRQDAQGFAVAGIWEWWKPPGQEAETSFSLLTINADGHEIMGHFHRPGDERRSLVIIPEDQYDAWLDADTEMARTFLSLAPLRDFTSEPAPQPKKGETASLL